MTIAAVMAIIAKIMRSRAGTATSALRCSVATVGPRQVGTGCERRHGPVFYDGMSYVARRTHRARALVAAAGAVVLISAAGCAGSDEPATSAAPATIAAASVLLAPPAFADFVDSHPDIPLINVHIPYEKHIEGTDAFIPFDSILESPDLPADKNAPIAIYCRSGNMSAQAATELVAAGYTNVIDLDGGMNAWAAAGDTLLDDPAAAGN
jgi:rhodanese-related sulfurtransferase